MRLGALLVALACAAPAAAQEEAVPAPPEVELRPATVRFRANLEDVHVRYMQDPVLDDTSGRLSVRLAPIARYAELCVAPCEVELPQTHLGLAAARGEHVHRFTEPLGVDGPTGVRIEWDDRAGVRLAGLLAMIVGGALGVATGGLALGLVTDDAALAGGLVAGSTLVTGSLVVGLVLFLLEDAASLRVRPLPADGAELFSSEWR